VRSVLDIDVSVVTKVGNTSYRITEVGHLVRTVSFYAVLLFSLRRRSSEVT